MIEYKQLHVAVVLQNYERRFAMGTRLERLRQSMMRTRAIQLGARLERRRGTGSRSNSNARGGSGSSGH